MPRYGWETHERIISPEEIYDEKLSKELVGNAEKVLRYVTQFYVENAPVEMKEIIQEGRSCVR